MQLKRFFLISMKLVLPLGFVLLQTPSEAQSQAVQSMEGAILGLGFSF